MKPIFTFILTLALSAGAFAQKTATVEKYAAKFKPPKLITMIGNFRDTMKVPVEMAEDVIVKPLRIIDAKGTVYAVSSYQFVYRKKAVTEDEATGKVSPTTTMKTSLFKVTPLPQFWQDAVRENLKAGEELMFVDIVVKDARGYAMYAPNLKLILQ